MKIFIANKFRGVDKADLKEKLKEIIVVLEKNGHQVFSYFRDKERWKPKSLPLGKVIKEAFTEIKKCDTILCFIEHRELSEGMLLEIGFAKALGKKVIILISKKCSFPTIEAIADKVIRFTNIKDLNRKLIKIWPEVKNDY